MTHQVRDISDNNAHPVDFVGMRASGVEAVVIKATQGTGYVNPDFAGDRAAARAAGLGVAAYHYAGFESAAAEASFFHAIAGPDAKIVDVEGVVDPAWIAEFETALGQAADEEMVYGSASTLPEEHVTRGLLWAASWGVSPPAEGEELWQYSGTGPMDLDLWVGPDAQFYAFFDLNPPNPPPHAPQETDMPAQVCVAQDDSGAVKALQQFVISPAGKFEVFAPDNDWWLKFLGQSEPEPTPGKLIADTPTIT